MSKKPFRVLALFDYNSFTGFSTVSKNLVSHWKRTFGEAMMLDIVAINYFGAEYKEGNNVRVISGKLKDIAKDDFGRHVFMRSMMDIDYDLIFILQDLGVVVPMIPHMKQILDRKKEQNKKQFKSILYFPVDFNLTAPLTRGLSFFDVLATYTEYGKRNVLHFRPELKGKVKVVPHGNNMKNFYPLPQEESQTFRNEYFGEENAGKFIIASINRNQSRKDIPTTIFGFMEYWEQHNRNALLYLHMNPEDPMGWNLNTLLDQTPLKKGVDYMFPPEEDYNKGADVAKLNKIYNSIDCFISTATGGGWELTVTEAMSAKKPTIIPKHTSLEHLGGADGERTYFLETLYPVVAMVDNIIRFQSDIYEISDTLNIVKTHLDSNSPLLQSKLEKAYKFVESHDWKDIAKSFSDDIKRLV